jgi:hypothetical protein
MKPTKRKAFNFLRSYFDALNEIPEDKDKLDFLLALINKQFLDIEPKDLSFIAKISYQGQRHAIEKSVKGYKDKMKTDLLGNPLLHPYKDPKQGGSQDPLQQEKEKGKEQEKEKFIIYREKYKFYATELFKDTLWIEAISRNHIKHKNNEVNKKTIHKYLKYFLTHLDETQEKHDNKKEFQYHFSNWLRKQKIEFATVKQKPIRYS